MKNLVFDKWMLASLGFLFVLSFVACGGDDEVTDNTKPYSSQDDSQNGTNSNNEGDSGDDPSDPSDDQNVNFAPESWYQTNYWDRTDREKIGLRGKVKKWYFNTNTHVEYEYDEAGRLTFTRRIEEGSNFPEWCEWYTYDSQGRLIKEVYARVTKKGGTEIDDNYVVETTEYKYGNGEQYVWVDPQSFDSRTFVNYLGPEGREPLNNLRKGLSECHYSSSVWNKSSHRIYTYNFNDAGNLLISRESYKIDSNGNREDDGENQVYTYTPIVYQGNYPYSGELNEYNIITSMTWRENGMPLAIDGPSGLMECSESEMRFVNPKKWTCKPGNPIDALVGFTYARQWDYDTHSGELILLQQWENQESEQAWICPTNWEYAYDSHGNWTSFKESYQVLFDGPEGDVQTRTISRTIEYY